MSLRWLFGNTASHSKGIPVSKDVSGSPMREESVSELGFSFVLLSNDSDDEFEHVENHPVYSRSLNELSYEESDSGLGNSSHKIIEAHASDDENVKYYLKFNDNIPMLYCESFLNHLYSMSLLHGVARCVVRYDEYSLPVALSSRELADFQTFKDKNAQLTQDELNDPLFRERFTRILAVMFRMHEDDGHSGNITKQLQVFDADCAFWDETCDIKGGRPKVDNGLVRDPKCAFNLSENDIIHFPCLETANPWYFPSLDASTTALFTNNPFTPSETQLVRNLKNDPATLNIIFLEFLDWMMDISSRFKALALLNIPRNLKVNPEDERTIVDRYCEKNAEINADYWRVLPEIRQFHDYLISHGERAIEEILVRCHIRNARLDCDKALNTSRASELDAAKVDPNDIIVQFNRLVSTVVSKNAMSFTIIGAFSSLFTAAPSLYEITPVKAAELKKRATQIADELVEIERKNGTDQWRDFVGHVPGLEQAQQAVMHL